MTVDHSVTITKRSADSTGHEAPLWPRLVIAFECQRPLCPGVRLSLGDVDEVVIGRGAERRWSRSGRQLAVAIPDQEVSRVHVRLVRSGTEWTLRDSGSKNGTLVGGVRTGRCTLADRDVIEVGRSVLVYRDATGTGVDPGDRDLAALDSLPDVFRTLCVELERRTAELERVAPTSVPVLITGETGTGKELVARATHALSGRTGSFVPVNCGALPRELVESELFGYRRGAFSGARDDRSGLARKADGGTLFLDEVAELPDESQVALLRLVQEGEVRPVGSAELVGVDVRVIAATHQDLQGRIDEGRFRRDLYGRLAGYEMRMTPLRERPEDIGSLIAALLARLGSRADLALDTGAAAALFRHPYPMNVRELEQALATAVAIAPDGAIGVQHLPEAMRAAAASLGTLGPEDAALRVQLIDALRQNRGSIAATARLLEKAPVQIRRWCRRLRIDPAEFRR
jgi:pSer/pThr/pTyr-binding forkhead associated (FHA) protein